MNKTDYKKELSDFYGGKVGQFAVVNVPPMNYLMVDGHGNPNTSPEYADAIQALYPVAYALKFICKKELSQDYSVMPLEGLWWTEDMASFLTTSKDDWLWTAMIMQPSIVTKELFERACQQVADKKAPKGLDRLRFETYAEGRAAQVMYVGPYADEGPTIKQLHAFIAEQGGTLSATNKHHHEIYLGDPRRTDPTMLKTIIRQPF